MWLHCTCPFRWYIFNNLFNPFKIPTTVDIYIRRRFMISINLDSVQAILFVVFRFRFWKLFIIQKHLRHDTHQNHHLSYWGYVMNSIWIFVIFLSYHQYLLMHICNSKLIEELQQIEVHLHLKLCSNMILTTFKIKFFPKAKTISLHDWQPYTIPQGRHWDSRHMLIRYQLANI